MIKRKSKSARVKRSKVSVLKSLENRLDRALSRFVRMNASDEGGTAQCVTCGALHFWKDMDCGHYIKRQHKSVRWDERNVGAQCRKCNRFAGGSMDQFAQHILDKHGAEVHAELIRLKHASRKWTAEELQALVFKYESAAREQEARLSGYER